MAKAEKIKQALKRAKGKGKLQIPKVFQLKLQNLSNTDLGTLGRLFLEVKWYNNYIIADIENRLNKQSEELEEVEIKTPNSFEKRELKILGSQIKDWLILTTGEKNRLYIHEMKGLKRFPFMAVQKDYIKSWHEGLFSKRVQNTGIGGITARLKCLATFISVEFLDRDELTRQKCSKCGLRQGLKLFKGIFECLGCGLKIVKNLNSACEILKLGLKRLARGNKALADRLMSALLVDRGEVAPVEWALPTMKGKAPHL